MGQAVTRGRGYYRPELLDAPRPTDVDTGSAPVDLPNGSELLDRVAWLRRKPWLI